MTLNQLVVETMQEESFDIRNIDNSHSAVDLVKLGRQYDVVITVRSRESDALCPVFPRWAMRLNWPYPNPDTLASSREERLRQIRDIRDASKRDAREVAHAYEQMGLRMLVRSNVSSSLPSGEVPKPSITSEPDKQKSYLAGDRGNSPGFIDVRYVSKR